MAAMVLGATGLVGRHLIERLLHDTRYARVVALARRPVELPAQLFAQRHRFDPRVIDFERLDDHAQGFDGVTHVFCALGTTIRRAGSRAAFARVDHDYPVAAGRLALEMGAVHYLLVSAIGADPRSRIFYNRVKGEVERDIRALGFPAVTIARPSLILGARDEFRLGEQFAKRLAWLTPAKWAPVEAGDIATALVAASRTTESRTIVIESMEVRRIARRIATPP